MARPTISQTGVVYGWMLLGGPEVVSLNVRPLTRMFVVSARIGPYSFSAGKCYCPADGEMRRNVS